MPVTKVELRDWHFLYFAITRYPLSHSTTFVYLSNLSEVIKRTLWLLNSKIVHTEHLKRNIMVWTRYFMGVWDVRGLRELHSNEAIRLHQRVAKFTFDTHIIYIVLLDLMMPMSKIHGFNAYGLFRATHYYI